MSILGLLGWAVAALLGGVCGILMVRRRDRENLWRTKCHAMNEGFTDSMAFVTVWI